jgi:Tfp pilus assembly protein PilW
MRTSTRSVLAVVFLATVLVAPQVLAGFAGTEVFLPSVGRKPGAGGSQWYTTVWVYNPNPTAVNLTFYLLERDRDNSAPRLYNDTLPAGEVRRYDNAIWTMFGVEVFGALRVVASERVVVNSRIYSLATGGEQKDSVGQFFAGVPASFAIGAGQKTQILGVFETTPSDASEFRYNFGFVETAGANTTVTVTVYDETGSELGSKSYSLRPYEQKQFRFPTEFPAISTTNARLQAEVTGGTGKVVAFGSGVANRSTDPSTFEMTFDDALLGGSGGLSAVAHDASLSGDGTTLSPLGIASGGVTSSHLASGAVTSSKIADGAVTSSKLATNAVTNAALADGVVGTAELANSAVSSAKLADSAVTSSKIADSAVTSSKLADGAVANADLASGAVTGAKVALPLLLSAGGNKALEVTNAYAGGIPGATLRALNSSTTGGIAGFFETQGNDATVVVQARGSGPLLKGFGANGGEEEFRFDNNGTLHLYNPSYSESIKLDATTGKATVQALEVAGHANASIPIAYGTFDSNAAKRSGTSNISATWDSSGNWYLVTIAGVTYDYRDYCALVTPLGVSPKFVVTYTISGKLTVQIFDQAGTPVQGWFQVVVFKP